MLALPLVAIGPDLVPALERCVRGMVVNRGWEERTRPAPLEKLAVRGNPGGGDEGLTRLLKAAKAIELGRQLCDEQLQISKLDAKRPLSDLAAQFGLSLNEARMCMRLFIRNERGTLAATGIREAEIEAGIRGADGRIVEDFR